MNEHRPLKIAIFSDPMFQENGLLLWNEPGGDCWIIDPGLPPQPDEFAQAIDEHDLTPRQILLTHCHADHIAGVQPLRVLHPQIEVVCPADEHHMLTNADANLSAGLGFPIAADPAERLIRAGERIEFGGVEWEVRDVRGHSPGAVAYYAADIGVVIVGDAVFAESIGRYDFEHSNREDLLTNIRDEILTLPDETFVYSGHGPVTTIGRIKTGNWVLLQELARLGGGHSEDE